MVAIDCCTVTVGNTGKWRCYVWCGPCRCAVVVPGGYWYIFWKWTNFLKGHHPPPFYSSWIGKTEVTAP